MISLRYISISRVKTIVGELIPIIGILAGIGISLAVFAWLYFDAKNKRETIVEISKNIDDPSKVQVLLDFLFDKDDA